MSNKPNDDDLDALVVMGEAAAAASNPTLSHTERVANQGLHDLLADHFQKEIESQRDDS
ncbi:hypothetical protein ACH41E_30410 [Streptomyces sp. NPDC020412]|uniref:hypothetical protein n=1 Tax=Streptomyces sp. NPDC020412 TaxID=3365073 RepID=UPI00378E510A